MAASSNFADVSVVRQVSSFGARLERHGPDYFGSSKLDPEKVAPVFRKDHAQTTT